MLSVWIRKVVCWPVTVTWGLKVVVVFDGGFSIDQR